MKTILHHFLLGAACVAALLPAVRADDDTVYTLAFSKPDAPRQLRVETMWADVKIAGADVAKVTVHASGPAIGPNARRPDGLRVIAAGSSFRFDEHDNVITLTQDASTPPSGDTEFEITVPHNTSVSVKVIANGEVEVKDLSGDVEVSNLNGSVDLRGLSGGVAVDSMNGEITARYSVLTEGKAHAFSSMNGQIALYVPTSAKATFHLRAQNGTVLTDFDEKMLVTKTEPRGQGDYASGINAGRAGMEAAKAGLEAAKAAIQAAGVEAGAAGRAGIDAAKMALDAANSAMDAAPGEPDATAPTPATAEAPAAPDPHPKPHAPRPPRPPRAPRAPTFPAFGGQVVTGQLNGGGVEIRATTMNGEITIREAK